MDSLVVGLIAYCLIREIFFLYSTQKLLNKLMSRNYNDYTSANKTSTDDKATYKAPEEEPEDLGLLTGYN